MVIHRVLPIVVLVAAAVSLMAAEPPAAETEYQSIDLSEGHFRCEVPKAWGMDRDEREEARIHYCGIFLYGPREECGLRPTLSVRYFAPDNTMFQGAEGYLRRQLEPGIIRLAKEVTSDTRNVAVAGRPGKSFTRDTVDYFPPDSLDTQAISVREEYYVVPHLGGFLVIKFASPTAAFAGRRAVLQRLLDSIHLLPERFVIAVRATAEGHDAEEVETRVTQTLEAQLAGLPHLSAMSSVSRTEASVVRLEFDYVAGLETARQEIQRRLASARERLPAAVVTIESPIADDAQPLTLVLSTTDLPRPRTVLQGELNALAERVVRDRLANIPGVANVELHADRQCFEIVPSLKQLAKRDIDVQELLVALNSDAKSADKGPLNAAGQHTPDDLRRRVVALRKGEPICVGDVADVRLGVIRSSREAVGGSEPAADKQSRTVTTVVSVQTLADADSGAVGRAVDEVLNEVRALLPEGAQLKRLPNRKVDAEFQIAIAGPNFAVLGDLATDIRRRLEGAASIVDARIDPQMAPFSHVELKREDAERYGFTATDCKQIEDIANKIVQRRSLGKIVGPHGLPIDVIIASEDGGAIDVANLPVRALAGERLSLRLIADLATMEEPSAINHLCKQRTIAIIGRFAKGYSETTSEAVRALCREVRLPPGYSINFTTDR